MPYTCNQDDVNVLFNEILDSSIFNYIVKIINLQIIFDNIIDGIFRNRELMMLSFLNRFSG